MLKPLSAKNSTLSLIGAAIGTCREESPRTPGVLPEAPLQTNLLLGQRFLQLSGAVPAPPPTSRRNPRLHPLRHNVMESRL